MYQVVQTPEQHYYLSTLLGINYTIQYKSSASNFVVDALSRMTPSSSGQLLLLSVPNFDFLNDLRCTLHASPDFQTQMSKVRTNPSDHPNYYIHNELLLFRGHIWFDSTNPYIPTFLLEFHETPLGGHLGIAKTTHRLESSFYWSTLRQDVKRSIRECSVCQQMKTSTCRPAGLLQPLPIPTGVWEDISMDFITYLPQSHGFTAILVVVDRYSKGVHFGALPTNYSTFKVASLFLNMVCKHHGIPRSIIFY